MKNKTWSVCFLAITAVCLGCIGGMTALIDPFFHYHAPLDALNYQIHDQRYQNDGIVKHFEYDAILTGTSVTENFKTSQFDALFNAHAVKVPFAGGSFKEINDNLSRALEANSEIRYIVRSLDTYKILADKDQMEEDFYYPTYLYDDRLLNDAAYLLNKDVFLQNTIITLRHTMLGYETTTFDEYSNWMERATFSGEALLRSYTRVEKAEHHAVLTEEERRMIRENVEQNVLSLIQAYPDVEFYYFFPPYSILWWDAINRQGEMKKQIDILREASEILVDCENLHLFSFYDNLELISNLDLYKDTIHYHEDVNAWMLEQMAADEYRLTKENYIAYWDALEASLKAYPYDDIYQNNAR